MRRHYSLYSLAPALLLAASLPAFATVFATVHGIVHDPQHRPIAGATVTLQSANSAFALHATTPADGEFTLPEAPIGVYRLTVTAAGFETATQAMTVESGTSPILHIPLAVSGATESVVVRGTASAADTVTPTTLITSQMIEETPGADRTTGMEMITDYVPGAYMTHDMLHMRGGHQTSWLIDGVEIPNTKIASNVGPQIDPKDIDSLETQRGSYAADVGDRTYGVFDVLPRNGFEFNRDGELMLYGGNLYTGEAQLAFGDHSEKTAWYASATGSRSNYGLATPVTAIDHDATNSESGFVSVIRNQTPKDQLRVDAQIPAGFLPGSLRSRPQRLREATQLLQLLRAARRADRARLFRDRQLGAHVFAQSAVFRGAVLSLQPGRLRFPLHRLSGRDDLASALELRGSAGRRQLDVGWNSFSGGLYSFYQKENDLFGVQVNDGSGPSQPNTPANANAGLVEFYLDDHLRLGQYVTLLGGERFTIYRAGLDEISDLSAHRRHGADSAAELGAARILRALLSARADPHSFKLGAELRGQPGRRRRCLHARFPQSATKSTSSASRFPTRDGCWMWTPSRTA